MATGNNKWVNGDETETERNKNYKTNDEGDRVRRWKNEKIHGHYNQM